MATDKPLISILMAVYEPRMDWLKEQLDSLNKQTYPNLRLYLRDDCSTAISINELEALVCECITTFPYSVEQNETNLGSNATFERLTQDASGDYFAYCDQDDTWLPEKLAVLQNSIGDETVLLVCSDMFIIDGNGKQVADSITKVRRHHVFHSGVGLAPGLLVSNFVTGCTMMIRAKTAKAAVPFCPYMVHDHYLAFYAAAQGAIISLPDRLISYRIHEKNQTLMMAGVRDKESYRTIRIESLIKRLEWLQQRFCNDRVLSGEITTAMIWAKARLESFNGNRSAKRVVWKYRSFGLLPSLFEMIMSKTPEGVFMFFVKLIRRNMV